MTLPRRVVAGTTDLLTRRFYLRPNPNTNGVYLYSLALAQQKHGIAVRALDATSNHHHDVLTHPRGVEPDFARDFHRAVAVGMKELHRIRGAVRRHPLHAPQPRPSALE